jgi:hypothetical protein
MIEMLWEGLKVVGLLVGLILEVILIILVFFGDLLEPKEVKQKTPEREARGELAEARRKARRLRKTLRAAMEHDVEIRLLVDTMRVKFVRRYGEVGGEQEFRRWRYNFSQRQLEDRR